MDWNWDFEIMNNNLWASVRNCKETMCLLK